ncbi:lactonase family protein [Pedobacter sp. Leaf176]|uniref:lactonase family protein n=1 Tax=Pedobacter sp. Leaf176 TaxID=1736286 RepID=UPI0006FE48B8|nr:lactonase family protein [Pedobacter sp. Leaf176]KQR69891.1 6-phosphogluconolactonase [Pedobacter sp. Leaf176]
MKKYNCLLLLMPISFAALAQQTNYNLLIGTYTNTPAKSEGIYTYSFNTSTADAKLKFTTKDVNNPSYIAISPDNKFAYVVNETGTTSTVSAFKYNAVTGALLFINKVESEGADPCYITADKDNVIVANYSGGSLVVFKRKADGALDNAALVIKHTGKSIDPKGRQETAHVHMVKFTPDRKFLICTDLGEDRIYIYNYKPKNTRQILTLKNVLRTNPGSGPRHLAFTPNGKFAYLAHEFNGSITGYYYTNGDLKKIQEIGTTPKSFEGRIDGADIHVSADGKFLYETNRGDANTISVFSILSTGILRFVETVSTLGKGPRNFSIDPSGRFVLVAHQYNNNVVIFNRNKLTGKLTDSGKRIEVAAPVNLVFTK